MKYAKSAFLLLFGVFIFLVFGGTFEAQRSWPKTSGTIVGKIADDGIRVAIGLTKRNPGREEEKFVAVFKVDDVEHGKAIFEGKQIVATDINDKHQVGEQVEIAYNPQEPEEYNINPYDKELRVSSFVVYVLAGVAVLMAINTLIKD